MSTATTTAGKRRANTEDTMTDNARPFGNDFPEHAPRPASDQPRPVEDAFAFTADRLDRLEHMIGSLQGTVQRVGRQLEPALTDGTYGRPEAPGDTISADPTPEDRRSTIAKRISGLGERADRLADYVVGIERNLEDLSDALEIG